jgi:hypothetical protein
MLKNFPKIYQNKGLRSATILAAALFAVTVAFKPTPSFAENGASIASGSAITADCVTRTINASGTTETQCSNSRDGYIVMLVQIGVFSIAAAGTLMFFKK